MALPGILARNWRLKISALVLAAILWVTMRLSDDRPERLAIPAVEVRVEHVHRDWYLVEEPSPGEVQMSVSGPLGDILRVAMSRPKVAIRVDSVTSADSVLTLMRDWVTGIDRNEVTIEDLHPSTVRLSFGRIKEEEIPVSVRLTGELPGTLALVGPPRANLLFINVRGPAQIVDELQTVFLAPFDLGQIDGGGKFEVVVDTTGMAELAVSPMSATLTVDAAPKSRRALAPRQIELPDGVASLDLDSAIATVTLLGADQLLEQVDTSSLSVRVAAESEAVQAAIGESGQARVALKVEGLPPFISAEISPDSMTVSEVAER